MILLIKNFQHHGASLLLVGAAVTRAVCLISQLEAWLKWSGAETRIYFVKMTYQVERTVRTGI